MTESADLLAAIAAAPADDLPRLVFADWLDDRGEPTYAQFIRDQIRLAQVPQWDPLAVRARHQLKDSLGIGRPFFGALPELPIFLKWHPEKAFRRGFGSGVVVHQLSGLLEAGPQLFDLAPVEELWLSAATLDDWRQLAKSPWLKHVRKLHFHFSQGLHEPIRCLAESKYAHNIDEIWFDTLETPAAGLVIEALAQSSIAGQLKGLHLRLVHTPSLPEVNAALAEGKFDKLERLSMVQAGLNHLNIVDLFSLKRLSKISELNLSHNEIGCTGAREMCTNVIFKELDILLLTNCHIKPFGTEVISHSQWIQKVKMLSMKCNYFDYYGVKPLIRNGVLKSIRSLDLYKNNLPSTCLVEIFKTEFWPQLLELNWMHNDLTQTAARKMQSNSFKGAIVALIAYKEKYGIDKNTRLKIRNKLGDRFIWQKEADSTGLSQ
jgi:uncharacterized protein (TIGR02996 family)